MWILLLVGIAFMGTLLFGGIQTWNLRHCQQQSAQLSIAIETQNAKVKEWESAATKARARASKATKDALDAAKRAAIKETILSSLSGPPPGVSCEVRERASLDLLRRARTP